MNFVSWEISVIAFLPALFLCGFIYYKDRIEKEPLPLLLLLFGLGAAAYLPTLAAEKAVLAGVDALFASSMSFSADGMLVYSSSIAMIFHKLLSSFVGIALLETAVKLAILYFTTSKSRHFNYMFDGIVYSVFVSIGFAAVENIRFAWINGWETLVLRSLASIPCHLIVGIIMGYFYTTWNAYRKAVQLEQACLKRGVISEARLKTSTRWLVLSGLFPLLTAGIYTVGGSIHSTVVDTLFYFVVFFLYGISFLGVDKFSDEDRSASAFARKTVHRLHPETNAKTWEAADSAVNTEEENK